MYYIVIFSAEGVVDKGCAPSYTNGEVVWEEVVSKYGSVVLDDA